MTILGKELTFLVKLFGGEINRAAFKPNPSPAAA
jgi:hypothetical protein